MAIFALSTPAGKSGVAVIRISGEKAADCFAAFGINRIPTPRTATLASLYATDNSRIDKAMLLWFPAPHSFTGESTVEIHSHGSIAVIQEIFSVLSTIPGFRPAEPGEFSRQAFHNGKMDLTEVEGLADLIESETRIQQRQAIRQMDGELHRLYDSWRSELIRILSLIEAYIDFPDEDLPNSLLTEVNSRMETLQIALSTHLSDRRQGEKLRHGLHIAIVGMPNVGKSSLLNFLAQREVAIVSPIAGTTRDVVESHLDIGGYPFIIADTAGLRSTTDQIEQEGIRRAKSRAGEADIKLALFDATAYPELDAETLALIDEDTIVIFNKSDLSAIDNREPIKGHIPLIMSLQTGHGKVALLQILEQKAQTLLMPSHAPLITRSRYRHHLQTTAAYLAQFSFSNAIELAAEDLRLAARELGKITGRIDVDHLLDEIFYSFCIGK